MNYLKALEAIDALIGRDQSFLYHEFCAEENPDQEQRDAARAVVIGIATGMPLAPARIKVDYGENQPPCDSCP